ncbi:uncharacterized protein BXZ73DRAFT_51208 [Epithele typhae]|uniref:uncharacterized protein n=1 Tax=Epithele typhae TaxID=378194 RepID=UPI002007206B|nr:uncharacterized protein BXZ73DRAFT_51208 [Epithele typhae]KAH9922815.1 hypothetical protein BXZ73DRAFT_51208 [Epithele typhae]
MPVGASGDIGAASTSTGTPTGATGAPLPAPSLKRSAADAFEEPEPDAEEDEDDGGEAATVPKKQRTEETGEQETAGAEAAAVDGAALAENLEEELQCGCCSAIVYRPVVVVPCQHFFCGSCVALWIRNGGTSCPACRSVSTSVQFSRPLQKVVDTLLRHAPSKARSVSERIQADAIYHPGVYLRIPSPRQASPEPAIPTTNSAYTRPCPHCFAGNQWGWRCPQPIVDPDVDPSHAWLAEEGNPPGHTICGNCETVLALAAPSTTRCDFCQVSFCGIGVPGRCVAAPLASQHPHGLTDIGDLIQCGEIYESFESNTVEVDYMLDYLTAQTLSPHHIYREIVGHIQSQPRGFAPLIELDLFAEMYQVPGGADPGPSTPRTRICRLCATEVLLYGLREWWVRERRKGFLEEHVMARPDCPDGTQCPRQKNHSHAPALTQEEDTLSDVDFSLLPSGSGSGVHNPGAPSASGSRAAPSSQSQEQQMRASLSLPPALIEAAFRTVPARIAAAAALDAADLVEYGSAPSSQDFRDEVDALL